MRTLIFSNRTIPATAPSLGLLALMLLAAVLTFSQSVNRSSAATAAPSSGAYVVVDTGQTKCYDNRSEITSPKPGQPFYGQDAQFQNHPASYTLCADGRIKGYDLQMPGGGMEKTFFVICVRGNSAYGHNNFHDNSDGTITDRATGLMWSKADSGLGMNRQDALATDQNEV